MYAIEDTDDLFAMPIGEDSCAGEPAVAWARCDVKAPCVMPARRLKAPAVPVGVRRLASMVHRAVMADGTTKFAIFRADLSSSRWSEMRSVCDCDDNAYERDGTGGR